MGSGQRIVPKGSWLLRPPPDDATALMFGFPYAGGGAGAYRQWPARLNEIWFCPLQPPGREGRFREQPLRTHQEWAADLADFLAAYAERPYFFIGHCGGVPLALSTILEVADRGLPLPERLIASSWGPPHRSLYGPLNFVDLQTADLRAEVRQLFAATGNAVREDFVDIAADVLRVDLELHRDHLYDAARRVPCPVTVVAWTDDEVVPPDVVCEGWEECADVAYESLKGAHFDYMRCPASLIELISRSTPVVRRDRDVADGG
jgi:surfactin synthase thioesterase subunit